ncbi:hypothetical protein EV359DRAFT_86749 [Lentinula novae-zelandiae]|nr:hypothetical protein EV359DRAFT_86749 [Lentinula novae-zelandiae]
MSLPVSLDPSLLGSCRNSPPKCQAFCGIFCTEDGLLDSVSASTKCLICGCFAASHIHPPDHKTQTTSTSMDPPPLSSSKPFPKPFPSGSATANSIFGARSGLNTTAQQFSASPFRDHIKERETRRESTNVNATSDPELGDKRRFNPAEADRKAQFDNITGRPKKKKKADLPKSTKSSAKISESLPKPVVFHIVLYGKPSLVSRGEATRPSSTEFQALWSLRRIRPISLPPHAAHFEICTAIELAFADLLPATVQPSDIQFCILQVQKVGRGQSALLKLLEKDTFNVDDLCMASVSAKPKDIPSIVVKTCFYITLPTGSSDIDPVDSENSTKSTSGKPRKKSKKSDDYSSDDSIDFDEENGANNIPESLLLRPLDFDILKRMLVNMAGPSDSDHCDWWTTSSEHHFIYSGYTDTTKMLTNWFQRLAATSNGKSASPDLIYQEVFRRIMDIISVNVIGNFTFIFSLGSLGMDLIVTCLETVFSEGEAAGPNFVRKFASNYCDIYQNLRELPTALLSLVKRFRERTFRGLWDPKNEYSQLIHVLDQQGQNLPNGSVSSIFYHEMSHINLTSLSSADIRIGLEKASTVFMDFILDWMNMNRDGNDYKYIFNDFATLCGALADRIKTHFPSTQRASTSGHTSGPSCSSPLRSSFTPTSGSAPNQPSATVSSSSTSSSSRMAAAQAFAERVKDFKWSEFVQALLQDYPHPELSKRLYFTDIKKLNKIQQYRKLYLETAHSGRDGLPALYHTFYSKLSPPLADPNEATFELQKIRGAFTLTTTAWILKFNQFYLQLAPEVDNNGRIEVEREGLRMEDEDVEFKDVEDGGAKISKRRAYIVTPLITRALNTLPILIPTLSLQFRNMLSNDGCSAFSPIPPTTNHPSFTNLSLSCAPFPSLRVTWCTSSNTMGKGVL